MPTLFFDTETTDRAIHDAPHTDNRQPDIVQLAAILRDDDAREMASINLIIQTDRHIEEGAFRTHGISKDVAEQFGVSPINAIYVFRDMLASADTVVAHNIAFDRKVTKAAVFRVEIPEIPWDMLRQRDTMLAATPICKLPGKRGFKWPTLNEAHLHFFSTPVDGAHDALVDVRACMAVYDELLKLNAFKD